MIKTQMMLMVAPLFVKLRLAITVHIMVLDHHYVLQYVVMVKFSNQKLVMMDLKMLLVAIQTVQGLFQDLIVHREIKQHLLFALLDAETVSSLFPKPVMTETILLGTGAATYVKQKSITIVQSRAPLVSLNAETLTFLQSWGKFVMTAIIWQEMDVQTYASLKKAGFVIQQLLQRNVLLFVEMA